MSREVVSEKMRAALKRLMMAFRATAEAKSRAEMSRTKTRESSRTRTSELGRRKTREVSRMSHMSHPSSTCRTSTRRRINQPLNQVS